MSDVTQLIEAAQQGDRQAAADLLPLVYDELRRLAAAKMAGENPLHTLDATALVHEAYLRLVDLSPRESRGDNARKADFQNRGHFFAAAAEAMRRILIETARRKRRVKHGGELRRVELIDAAATAKPDDLLALDEALSRLAELDAGKAQLVTLRFFGGLSMPEAATTLNVSLATAERWWAFAKTWLYAALNDQK